MDILTLTLSRILVSSPLGIPRETQKQNFLRLALEQTFLNFPIFLNRIVDLWNGLPVAIRITDQLSLFSNNILITNSSKERFL